MVKARIIFTIFMLAMFAGCYRVRLDVPVSGDRMVRSRQHFFVMGLIGDNEVNLKRVCPTGVTSFGDEFRPLDLLFALGTLGLYTPKTVLVRCAA
jgi:hypothetical protein